MLPTEIEGNELIAKFMGATPHETRDVGTLWKIDVPFVGRLDYSLTAQLEYHSSWDWLIPVIEKIHKDYDFTIQWYDGNCIAYCNNRTVEATEIATYGNYTPTIKNVWLTVIKMIKVINKTKSTKS